MPVPAWVEEAYEKMVRDKSWGKLTVHMEAGVPRRVNREEVIQPPNGNGNVAKK